MSPRRIDLDGLRHLLEAGAQLVEVLPPDEYAELHLPGAINLPLKQLDAKAAGALDSQRAVAVYCWDWLCDMSPRAACRLEALGFLEVYDYVAGKVDWLAHNLPVEGERAQVPTAGRLLRDDIVTCSLDDRLETVRAPIERSPYGFALVTTPNGTLLGRVRRSALEGSTARNAEDAMEPGPSTVRPDTPAAKLTERLGQRRLQTAIVTTPEGRLLGVVLRRDLERATSASAAPAR